MKILLAVLLCAALLIPACAAAGLLVPTDPASRALLTGSDLAFVREQVIAELKSRPEWQETKIPAGQWTVGTDLPAGVYSFRHTDAIFSTTVTFTHKVGHSMKESGFLLLKDAELGKAEPADGTLLVLDGPVIMAPPVFASVKAKDKDPEAVPAYTAGSLTDIPYSGLLRLQRELLELIVSGPDCESVLLPAGIWTVGEDIPAGTWTAVAAERGVTFRHYKDAVTYNSNWQSLLGRNSRLDILLKDGWKLEISNPVRFIPANNQ